MRLFPLHGCGGLRGDIVDDAVDMLHLIGNAVRDLCQHIIGDSCPVGGHEIVGGDGADGKQVVIGTVVAHDTHGADTGQDAEELRHLALIAILCHFIPEHPVGLLENFHLLGGDLKINWDRENNTVYLEGPAVTVFKGEIDL